jgi:hypothetical protein
MPAPITGWMLQMRQPAGHAQMQNQRIAAAQLETEIFATPVERGYLASAGLSTEGGYR